ncbi:hypothetical protein Taro_050893 [Colocasia esculenta]|uniref:Uncharacterized protein n=1 Tax=Colocasia esculenta TaxID=4460 RepID=A0A843XF70_COLES|nr:hypothetical protein [Colocasia esculenta]
MPLTVDRAMFPEPRRFCLTVVVDSHLLGCRQALAEPHFCFWENSTYRQQASACRQALPGSFELPTGDFVCTLGYLEGVTVEVQSHQLPAGLFALQLHNFDAILGMDWLEAHSVLVDC